MEQPPSTPPKRAREQMVPRGPRCELILKVEYETLGQLRTDYLSNLGSGGLYLRTSLPLVVGQRLQMTISFPEGLEPIRATGEVRWVSASDAQAAGVGVELVDLDTTAKTRIDALVAAASSVELPATARPLRAVLLETNPVLRDIFKFQMGRFAKGAADQRVWELDLACASNTDELFEALGARLPQLAILDFENQPEPPAELLKRIRGDTRYSRLPIILLGDADGCTRDSRTMFVKKPFSVKPLFTTILLLLDR